MSQIDKEKRKFYIHEDIDSSISNVNWELLQILANDDEHDKKEKNYERQPIHIYINSHGGAVDDMWSLVDIMLASKTPIYTYCTSYADSCGFLIFIAGKKRFITKHTKMCCHQFSGGMIGMYQDMFEYQDRMNRLWDEFEKYILEQTNISKSRLEEVRDKKLDWYIYSEESIDLGVATNIITEF